MVLPGFGIEMSCLFPFVLTFFFCSKGVPLYCLSPFHIYFNKRVDVSLLPFPPLSISTSFSPPISDFVALSWHFCSKLRISTGRSFYKSNTSASCWLGQRFKRIKYMLHFWCILWIVKMLRPMVGSSLLLPPPGLTIQAWSSWFTGRDRDNRCLV